MIIVMSENRSLLKLKKITKVFSSRRFKADYSRIGDYSSGGPILAEEDTAGVAATGGKMVK